MVSEFINSRVSELRQIDLQKLSTKGSKLAIQK